MNYTILEPYKDILIRHKKQSLKNVVNYYDNSFLPELSETTGRNQASHRASAQNDLNSFYDNARNKTPLKYLGFSKYEILYFLRHEAIEHRKRASDFPSNPYIIMRNLRKAVTIANILIHLEPKFKIYSLHWICSCNQITLN